MVPVKRTFVDESISATNFFSVWLLDLAGNPYGNYSQEEVCVYCNAKLKQPPERNVAQKIITN